jgi:predicted lipoprotein with Yx(FWY)xxD motif
MRLLLVTVAALLLTGGCGGDNETPAPVGQPSPDAAMPADEGDALQGVERDRDATKRRRRGTRVVIRGSEFGEMLFDSRRQAIYIFEKDPKGRTVCYGECAEAWPPVLSKGKPVAGKGVDAGLLGTVERRDGTRQVTYTGKPLYYYAHEAPGEVRCHNVNLNGGFWWVVGPDGERLA